MWKYMVIWDTDATTHQDTINELAKSGWDVFKIAAAGDRLWVVLRKWLPD